MADGVKVKLGQGQVWGNGLFGESGIFSIDPVTGDAIMDFQGTALGISVKISYSDHSGPSLSIGQGWTSGLGVAGVTEFAGVKFSLDGVGLTGSVRSTASTGLSAGVSGDLSFPDWETMQAKAQPPRGTVFWDSDRSFIENLQAKARYGLTPQSEPLPHDAGADSTSYEYQVYSGALEQFAQLSTHGADYSSAWQSATPVTNLALPTLTSVPGVTIDGQLTLIRPGFAGGSNS